jgi:hypothetical protein
MDPDAALAKIREMVALIHRHNHELDVHDDADALSAIQSLASLADLVAGLDQWLSQGGSLPDGWMR